MAHLASSRLCLFKSHVDPFDISGPLGRPPHSSQRDSQLLIIAIDRRGPDCGTRRLAQWSTSDQFNDPPIWFLLCMMTMLAFRMQPKGSDQIFHIDSDRRLCEATDKKPVKASLALKGTHNDVDYYNDGHDNHSDVNKNNNGVRPLKPWKSRQCELLL